ncbi:MAG: Peptidoglycan-binding lysin domain protein [Herbinix sp.]|jgi:spore germination protein|nr:Peptidoglycan-binding lysin domain protein [Herbinix sp.]
MRIHTVQPNDTIFSIADAYNIPLTRLLKDNNLPQNYTLSIGQSLIITNPVITYIVQEGDTLSRIATAYEVSELQLMRNNPQLLDRDYLYLGEELVISYDHLQTIQVNGYAFSNITTKVLRQSLPFLTYLTIINYRVTADGTIVDVNDTEIIEMAKSYRVAPVMMISSITEDGVGSFGTNHAILINPGVQENLIQNLLAILNAKGLYGVNLGFQSILNEDIPLYIDFVTKVTTNLNSAGYQVFVTLVPSTYGYISGINMEIPYFTQIGQATNYAILMSYQWSTEFMPTVAQTTVNFLSNYLGYVMNRIPVEKLFLGLTRIAYDWELPYVEGQTIGTALTNVDALNLANQTGAVINYDETTQTPYFNYNTTGVEHFVWFKDARSIKAIVDLVVENDLKGISVWNVMYYAPQTWLIINTQYEIENVI